MQVSRTLLFEFLLYCLILSVSAQFQDQLCTVPGGFGKCVDVGTCPTYNNLNLFNQCFRPFRAPGICCLDHSNNFFPFFQMPQFGPNQQYPGNSGYPNNQNPQFGQQPGSQNPGSYPSQPNHYPNNPNPSNPPIYSTQPPFVHPNTQPAIIPTGPSTEKSVANTYREFGRCGRTKTLNRVAGGSSVDYGEYPWMAAIYTNETGKFQFKCGGTLISSLHVLSAAHCFLDEDLTRIPIENILVRTGDNDLTRTDEPSSPVTSRISDLRTHPSFTRSNFMNDIALLFLARHLIKTDFVHHICLPKSSLNLDSLVGKQATVVGWGVTDQRANDANVLRQAAVPVWSTYECDRAFPKATINDNFICAASSQGGVDACQGDSGGPLMMLFKERWMQIGIVSTGRGCGVAGKPGIYTFVPKYVEWISQNTE